MLQCHMPLPIYTAATQPLRAALVLVLITEPIGAGRPGA